MQWCEAIVHTTTVGSDVVSDWMVRLGAAGTEIVDRADVPDPDQPADEKVEVAEAAADADPAAPPATNP